MIRSRNPYVDVIETLERQLKAANKRIRELELRLMGPLPTVGPDVPVGPVMELTPEWGWSNLQPQDEALEDTADMVRNGFMDEVEAAAILEQLGFQHTNVTSDSDHD